MGKWKDQYGIETAHKIESISEDGCQLVWKAFWAIQNAEFYYSTQCWITHARQGPSPLLLESDRALQKCSLKYSKEPTVSSELKSLELGQWRGCKAQSFESMCVYGMKSCVSCSLSCCFLLFCCRLSVRTSISHRWYHFIYQAIPLHTVYQCCFSIFYIIL